MPPFSKLNEIVKLSALKATSALSKLLQQPIGVDIFPIEVKGVEDITKMLDLDEDIIGSYIPLVGKLNGAALLLYRQDSAKAICNAMLHLKGGDSKEFTAKEIGVLQEVANIIIGNFLTAFALPLKVDKLMHRTPDFSNENFKDFFHRVAIDLPNTIKDGLVVDISFQFKHTNINGTAIFLFNETEMNDLIDKLSRVYT